MSDNTYVVAGMALTNGVRRAGARAPSPRWRAATTHITKLSSEKLLEYWAAGEGIDIVVLGTRPCKERTAMLQHLAGLLHSKGLSTEWYRFILKDSLNALRRMYENTSHIGGCVFLGNHWCVVAGATCPEGVLPAGAAIINMLLRSGTARVAGFEKG